MIIHVSGEIWIKQGENVHGAGSANGCQVVTVQRFYDATREKDDRSRNM